MKVHFDYTLAPETFRNATQVLSYGTSLIPSPTPPDLRIEASNVNGLLITFSIEYTTPAEAADAIVKALKTEPPS